jgi:FkbM family methyltransferase
MWLDANDDLKLFRNGIYEPFETAIVRACVKPGDVVLDIGAHIGYYTLILANCVGTDGCVYAFEPDPANFRLLTRNVHSNHYRHVTLLKKAVSDRCGDAVLLQAANSSHHSLLNPGAGRVGLGAETLTIDAYLQGRADQIHFVKIDTEGCELNVIKGMSGVLNRSPQVTVMMEFAPSRMVANAQEPRELLSILLDQGFCLWNIDEQTDMLVPLDIDRSLEEWMPAHRSYTNLLCLKSG